MAVPIIMPRQGQSVESCIITRWFKKKGDTIKKGEILFSYETDKAAFEEECPEDGIVLELFFEEGEEVPVLTHVAIIGKPGENFDEFIPSKDKRQTGEVIQEKDILESKEKDEIQSQVYEVLSASSSTKIKISPRAKNLADKLGVPYKNINGSGPGGRIIEKDIELYMKLGNPLSRLSQHITSLEDVGIPQTGTGPGGRVLSSDLYTREFIEDDVEIKTLSSIRKIIAQNMLASLQNSAQLTHHMSADARRLLEYRSEIKKKTEANEIVNITLNDMICYAVVQALKKMPEINSHFLGNSIKTFKKVHLGIAVDTNRGLMVPTLRNADNLSIQQLSTELKKLADKCKLGSIDPELLKSSSASFTVSNLGSFGVEMFTPVINLPQSGILGVNTIIHRPGDIGNGIIGFIPYVGLSLTYDHRVLDGAPASAFLREIKLQIENLKITI